MRRGMVIGGAVVLLTLGACGNDDDDVSDTQPTTAATSAATTSPATTVASTSASTTGGAAGTVDSEVCALATELFEQEDLPTAEQLTKYQQIAPPEIADAVSKVAEPLIASDGNMVEFFKVLAEDENEAALAEINAYEEAECDIPHSESEGVTAGASKEIESDAARVDVEAVDFEFRVGEISGGRTSFVLTNNGEEAHVLAIGRLAEGFTLEQALESETGEGLEEEWTTELAAPGGDEEVITLDLEPGNYGMVCFIPTTDGTPHAFLGMQHAFTVT